jgi:hypothetical protein
MLLTQKAFLLLHSFQVKAFLALRRLLTSSNNGHRIRRILSISRKSFTMREGVGAAVKPGGIVSAPVMKG